MPIPSDEAMRALVKSSQPPISVDVNKPNLDQPIEVGNQVQSGVVAPPGPTFNPHNLLQRYSLTGYANELEEKHQHQKPLLGSVCQSGEATVWYAKPNTGKTLFCLHLLIEAVEKGRVDPSLCYYVAADDSSAGLLQKLRILEEYGVNVLSPGHKGFESRQLTIMLDAMIKKDAANGIFLIADTLKKFVSLMDKKESSGFADVIRQFVMKGGTFLGLAHTNKQRTGSGKLVHAGTSDILEDFDAAYILDEIEQSDDANLRTIGFECIKLRSGVSQPSAYSYSVEDGITYPERLSSVQALDQSQIGMAKQAAVVRSDAELISAIAAAILGGVNTKMLLATKVGMQERIGRQAVVKVIERYTGSDPAIHHWDYEIRERGSKVFALIDRPTPVSPPSA